MTKAPLGGEKNRPQSDRAKRGVKRSLLTEAHGVPIGLAMAGANRHDMKLVKQTVNSLVVKRPRPTKKRPQGMCLDKGYDYSEVRDTLKEFGFTAHIQARGEEAQAMKRHAGFKARRWVVERTHRWMNRFRRVLIRWGQVAGQLSRLSAFRLCPHRVPELQGYSDRHLVSGTAGNSPFLLSKSAWPGESHSSPRLPLLTPNS